MTPQFVRKIPSMKPSNFPLSKIYFISHILFITYIFIFSAGFVRAEVPSSEQIVACQRQLDTIVKGAEPPAFKAYLQGLQKGQVFSSADFGKMTNAVRVAEAMQMEPHPSLSFFAFFAVPAMSPLMRLPETYPDDGHYGREVQIVLAQDQEEAGSFVVFPFENIDEVNLKIMTLKNDKGDIFPADDLDLKVVKIWYQNGNAWLSYFADPGLKLVPELLLHDENLIRVDEKERANYARVKTAAGTREIWISAPQKLDVGFDPYQEGFADAATLQPVGLRAGQFKQFVVIARAAEKTKPGLYRGVVEVEAPPRHSQQIPVAIKVLPFALPLPKTNYDIEKDFVAGLMGSWPKISAEHPAFLPTLKNLRQHNILHSGPGVGFDTPSDEAKKLVQGMKEAGFLTKPIFGWTLPGSGSVNRTPQSVEDQVTIKRLTRWYRDFYQENFGNSDVFIKNGDEQPARWMISNRPIWRITQQQGLKTYIAGHINTYFPTSGYVLDSRPTAGWPSEADKPALWNQMGHGYTSFYAGQHTGSENPAFVRRQNGLLGYLSNYDMVDNYEFAYGSWNDRATDLYRPMVLAYPVSNGLVDTLAWEGFRQGIDDIRYATKLRQLAEEAIASGDLDRIYAGRKVKQWFAQMDGTTANLNTVRLEMIDKIEQLLQDKQK